MAPRPKKAEQKPVFPPECCGVCKFSTNSTDVWRCWVKSKEAVVLDGSAVWTERGAPIDSPLDPACGEFKPRMNA